MELTDRDRLHFYTLMALACSGIVIWYEADNYIKDSWFAFDFIVTIGVFVSILVLGVPAFIYSRRSLKTTGNKWFNLPINILIVGVITATALEIAIKVKSSRPVILWAHYDGGVNGVTLKLYDNGTYEIENYSFLGGDYHRGEYSIVEDTIYLVKEHHSEIDFIERKLVITPEKVLFELNEEGEYDDDYISMRIIRMDSVYSNQLRAPQ
ncbi:MAG: hypothetical protein HWD92_07550 [Flavobacteriia bacterium]|nr:hypothetical protein [Flavobacteriia bacterium]